MTDKQLTEQIRASAAKLCAELNAAAEAGLSVHITVVPGCLVGGDNMSTLRKDWRSSITATRTAYF
jgi:hypothetical protein